MADRYWILGTGTWSSTNTANWSASSGGAGGASVPTSADNVFFDVNSNVGTGAFTVTMANSPRVCNDFTASGLDGTMTLAGSGIGLTVSGSLTFQATNFTRSYTGTTTFNATTTGKTVTTNGVSLTTITFDGVGGAWTLGSALTASNITITNGTFDTSSSGNYAVTASAILSNNSNTRTINLNASTITLSVATGIDFRTSTGLTFNAGTSQISLSNISATFRGGGKTFYNVSFVSTGGAIYQILDANTFNNLTFVARTSAVSALAAIRADQTINGTLSVQPSPTLTGVGRILLQGVISGTVAILTCNAVSLYDVDFNNITITGAASPASGTRLGDAKGNSGITFPAAKTVYFGQTGSANWGATGSGSWSATSGGALDATMFPLAQDTAIFPAATYPASGSTVTFATNQGYKVGTVDMSLRTSNTITLDLGGQPINVFGDWKNGTGTTLISSNSFSFDGRTTQNITTANVSMPVPFFINSAGGTVILQDNYTNSSTLQLSNGTLNLNGKTLTNAGNFTISANTNTKNITFNGGTIVCSGASATQFNNTSTAGFTTTAGTGTGTISMTAATAKTFVGGGATFNCTLNQGGAGALTITGANTFSNITNTYKSTGATSILFTAGTTSTFTDWNANGEATRLLTIGSVTAASHTLSKASGTVSSDFLSISRSTATGGAGWYAGANSTDGGNNSGWIFTAPPGGGYTIVANNGAYTVTGQSATLLRSKVLTGAYGTYTVTGQSATLLRSKVLSANNGLYTVTGQSATLLRSKILTGAYGSYTVTGQSATLLRSKVLTGAYGAYAVTGQSATLLRSKVLSANNGVYTVTGQSATLLRSKVLSGSYGSYTVTGQSATLLRSKVLSGTYGVYTITGQSATLSKGRFLLGDYGTYGVTGQNAVISYVPITVNADQLLVKLRSFTERRRF